MKTQRYIISKMALMRRSVGFIFLAVAGMSSAHEFSVLQFNIWNEANQFKDGLERISEVILESDADIVAFSEVRNKRGDWHEKIVAELKESERDYYGVFGGGDVGLISRYPILKTEALFDRTKQDQGSLIAYHLQLPGGGLLIVCSAHLDYRHYAVNLVRGYNGGTPGFKMLDADQDDQPDPETNVKKVMAYNQKSFKDEAVRAFITYAAQPEFINVPIILAGDFNDGSHLDWTDSMKNLLGHNGLSISWKNSRDLYAAGFVDAYRELYPDPVTHPCITWPSPATGRKKSTSWAPKSDERDRVDYIYTRSSSIEPIAAYVVGPRQSYRFNELSDDPGEDVFLCDSANWPSDHKGVLIQFKQKKAALSSSAPPSD
jgi:endonuclease/exonuclease/phosphatase family metal-dependent hydrolase